MALFVVDPERCQRDGACVAECPPRIIQLPPGSVPTPADDAAELCINCGHCVAVCPQGALSLRTMSPEQCPPVRDEWALDPERVEHFLRARRSIRSYRSQPVPRETLAKLIDVARFAPTGSNRQLVRWLVVHDSGEVRRLAGLAIDWHRHLLAEQPEQARAMRAARMVAFWEAGVDYICRGAPHLIVAFAPTESGPTSCTIALTYLELAAPSFGLGACWDGYFTAAVNRWPPLQQALDLPAGHSCFGAMMVGYPRYRYKRLPLRNEAQITWH